MFTRIVEAVGSVAAVSPRGETTRLAIDAPAIASEAKLGDSISVNGGCLTVVSVQGARLGFDAIRETLERTALGSLRAGSRVNLERAMRADARLDGHIVQGHVDATGRVRELAKHGRDVRLVLDCPAELATQLVPKEDRHYYPRSYLVGKLAVALGGRVAERLVFAETSTGAQSDLKEATETAEKMVAQWGMSEKIGPMYVDRGEEHPFLGRKLTEGKSYSERLAWIMDEEIRGLVLEAEARAEAVLAPNRESLEKLAQALLAEEVLDQARIEAVIGHPKR